MRRRSFARGGRSRVERVGRRVRCELAGIRFPADIEHRARALAQRNECWVVVFQSGAMLYIRASKLSTYADVAVVCGAVESQKNERNGRVLGEGETFAHYMTIPSLQEYVLVAYDAPKIEVFRPPNGDTGSTQSREPARTSKSADE